MTEKKTVLIVDDTPDNLTLISNLLKDDYDIRVANNGEKALRISCSDTPPDLILLDIIMPGMDGYAVCTTLKEDPRTQDIPVIFLTAKAEVEDERRGFELGAVDYITKPISPPVVTARVRTHLRLKSATDQLRNQNDILEEKVRERTRELTETNKSMARFVPDEFLKELGKDKIRDVALGDCKNANLTVFFSDIRDFTTLSESMTPREAFEFINSYFSTLGPIIRTHGGFIDKYIGDSIMALFHGSPDKAVHAAVEIQRAIKAFNQKRTQEGKFTITAGIGIHRGNLILGTIGEEMRMETTVISSCVNLASRLEGLTKYYGARIIISEDVRQAMENQTVLEYRYLDWVKVKGSNRPIGIHEVLDLDSDPDCKLKLQTRQELENAINLYNKKDFVACIALLGKIVAQNPQDEAARFYIRKCERNLNACVDEEWDGTEEFTNK